MSSKTQREVAIVGTSHSIQIGAAGEGLAEELSAFLTSVCDRRKVRAIAEEVSPEALSEKGLSSSLGMHLARRRALPHRMIDPDRATRAKLGITQENDIRASAWLRSLPRGETDALVQAEYTKREAYWLDQLRDLDTWPVLFICGANHVQSFSIMLANSNIRISIEASDWPVEDI